jgi:hypothetical protein
MLTYGVSGTAAGSAAILHKLKDLVMLKFNDHTDKSLAYPTSVAGAPFTCFTSTKVHILTQKVSSAYLRCWYSVYLCFTSTKVQILTQKVSAAYLDFPDWTRYLGAASFFDLCSSPAADRAMLRYADAF